MTNLTKVIEIWIDIPGYEGLYQVSNFGRIRSLNRIKFNGKGYYTLPARIISIYYKSNHGYPTVHLTNSNGKKCVATIHRLVATAFVPNPENLPVVLHSDDNKLNLRSDNLTWGTQSENLIAAFKTGVNPGHRKRGVLNKSSLKIGQYDLNGKLIKVWDAINDARRSGFNAGCIVMVCSGKTKRTQHKGFIWKYVS